MMTASGPDIDVTKDTFTVYLSGLDNMGSPDQQTRSDTNLILIVNPKANHIDMVSLPRDGYIPNAAYDYKNDKLTHTGNDGIENSVETIQNFFGIPIDYYARVSFNSLIEIVDTIGGIDVDVEIDFCEQDENRSFKKEDLICLKKGKQHLNGKQALAYSRHRKTKGYDNAGRERAQQRIIKAKDIDSAVTGRSHGHPVRCLRNQMTREYVKLEQEGKSFEELEYLTLGKLREAVQEGDITNGTVMAGQIAGMISKTQTCKEMIDEMMEQAEKLLNR